MIVNFWMGNHIGSKKYKCFRFTVSKADKKERDKLDTFLLMYFVIIISITCVFSFLFFFTG